MDAPERLLQSISNGDNLEDLAIAVQNGVDIIYHTGPNGGTGSFLHAAAGEGRIRVLRGLLDAGAMIAAARRNSWCRPTHSGSRTCSEGR